MYGARVENAKPKLFSIYWNWPGFFFSLFIGVIVYLLALKSFDLVISNADKSIDPTKHVLSFAFGLLGFLFKLLDKSIINIQRTITKLPLVGAEEFEECLQAILSKPKLIKEKIIIVFDNIDRAPPSSAQAILAGISAFFDSQGAVNNNVIIVVPFDPNALRNEFQGEKPLLNDCEKMFDSIISLPKLILEDLSDFAYDKLNFVLEQFSYREEQLKDLAYLISFSPYKSQREIMHQINQLASKLRLAQTLENTHDSRLITKATLLPPKTITNHPVTLLKLLICEKIYPGYTEHVVKSGQNLDKVFKLDKDFSLPENLTAVTEECLKEFLQATSGIPKDPPQSASPFLYMKGPDQVLAIPSGDVISSALYMGDDKKLNEVLFQDGNKVVSDKDITSVVKYHREKYAKNPQALKNAVRALMGGLATLQKVDKSLSIELCEIILLASDVLKTIFPGRLANLTNDFLETNAVNQVWQKMDAEFKDSLKAEDLEQSDTLRWASEYFKTIIKQNDGIERSGLRDIKVPLAVMTQEDVVNALGEDYPGTYLSTKDILLGVKNSLTETDIKKSQAYRSIVFNSFSSCKDVDGAEPLYKDIAELWQKSFVTWVTSKDDKQDAEKLSAIIACWPSKSEKAKTFLAQTRAQFIANATHNNNKSNAGFSHDVLDVCVAFYMTDLPVDTNLNAITHQALTFIDATGLAKLRDRYLDQNEIWETLLPHAKNQLIKAIDKNKYYDGVLVKDSSIVKSLASQFTSLTNKDVFLATLLASANTFDIADALVTFSSATENEARVTLLSLYGRYEIDEDKISALVEGFIAKPDKSNSSLIEAVGKEHATLKLSFSNFAISELTLAESDWTEKECDEFEWVHPGASDVTDATLKDLIDRAIDRGLQSGSSDDVKKRIADQVLKIWEEEGHAFKKKSFRIFLHATPPGFQERIEAIADRENIRESPTSAEKSDANNKN